MAARYRPPLALQSADRTWRLMLLPMCFLAIGVSQIIVSWAPLPLCGFAYFTRLPCPLCGGTRACAALADGDLLGAWHLNQGGCVVIVLACLHAAFLGAEGALGYKLSGHREWGVVWAASLVFLFGAWMIRLGGVT